MSNNNKRRVASDDERRQTSRSDGQTRHDHVIKRREATSDNASKRPEATATTSDKRRVTLDERRATARSDDEQRRAPTATYRPRRLRKRTANGSCRVAAGPCHCAIRPPASPHGTMSNFLTLTVTGTNKSSLASPSVFLCFPHGLATRESSSFSMFVVVISVVALGCCYFFMSNNAFLLTLLLHMLMSFVMVVVAFHRHSFSSSSSPSLVGMMNVNVFVISFNMGRRHYIVSYLRAVVRLPSLLAICENVV